MAVGTAKIGAATSGAGASPFSLNPALPASLAAGDVMYLAYGDRGHTGTWNTPSGWTQLFSYTANGRNITVAARAWQSGDAAPTVTYTGGGTGDTAFAQIIAFPGADTTSFSSAIGADTTSSGSQNIVSTIGIAGCAAPNDGAIVYLGLKGDDWTSVADLAEAGYTYVEIGEPASTVGNDGGMVWGYFLTPTGATFGAKIFTVTGGGSSANLGKSWSVAPEPAGGTTYTKAGTVVMGAVASAVDVATFAESGKAVLGSVLAGADQVTYAEAGTVAMGGVLSGLDAATLHRVGTVTLGAVASGTGDLTLPRTGTVTLGAVASGADAVTLSRTGTVSMGAVISGADVATLNRLGTVTLGAVAAGTDAVTYAEAGKVIAGMAASGASVYEQSGAAAVTPRRTLMGVGT
jgi:hypothetical protein